MKRFSLSLLIICLILSLCGCTLATQTNQSRIEKDDANVIHLALEEDIESPDVQVAGCSEIASNIYSRLVSFTNNSDGSSTITGDLAESWDISSDGKEYTFHLRENVRFSNGQEFEADDVLFTVDRMLKPEIGALSNEAAEYVNGAYDVILGDKESVEGLGIIIIDKFTVKIVLKEAWTPFLSALTDTSWSIYNRDAKDAGAYCTGTGPYIFDDWKAGDYIFLSVNYDYYLGKPSIDGILYYILPDSEKQLELFTAGELDVIKLTDNDTIDLYLNDKECSNYIVADKQLDIWYYSMNQNIAPFSEKAVRMGLQRSIDRKSILSQVFHKKGQILNGIIPIGMQGYQQTTSRIKYNISDAIELFSDAGFSEGFSLNICQTGNDPVEEAINTMVSQQLAQCNIQASIKMMDTAAYFSALTGGTLSMHLCHVICEYNEPSVIFDSFTSNGTARNSINSQNSDLVKRCTDVLYISDTSTRLGEYQNLEELIIHDDATVIPLFQVYSYVLVNPRVQDYVPGSDSIYNLSIEL